MGGDYLSHRSIAIPGSSLGLDAESLQDRPYKEHWWPELQLVFHANSDDIVILSHMLFELSFRSRKSALELREAVVQQINTILSESFVWPTTDASIGDGVIDDHGWPKQGLLGYMGYCVGANGSPQSERIGLLNHIYYNQLPNVHDIEYMRDWGEPNTGPRLQKMANSIATFVRNAKRRGLDSLGPAIRDWTDDLDYLHANFYVGRYDFLWPSIGD